MGELQLRRVLDTLFVFVGVVDLDGTLVEVNQAALAATGISESDVVGKKFWDCHWWSFSTESQELLRESINRAAGGEHVRYDVLVRMAGETRRWIDLQLAPLRDQHGGVIGVVPSAIDITERKMTEERLRASEERLRRASRAARLGIWEWNVTTGSAYWSPEAYELFGATPGHDVSYRRWVGSVHPADRERAMEATSEAVLAALRSAGDAQYRDEYRVVHDDGAVVWLESAGAFQTRNGQLLTMGVVRDVTERKQAEHASRESDDRLRFVAERAEVGYWHWDLANDFLEWSPLCKRLFGIPGDEPMSYARFIEAVHPKDRERVADGVRECLNGSAEYDIEFRSRWPDGTVRWLHAKGSATFDGSHAVRMAGIALDITDRKQADKLLAEQTALLETLTGKAPVGFAFVDKMCRYVRVNDTLAKMNGVSAAGHIGRTVADVVPKVWAIVEPLYRKALAGEAVSNVEVATYTRASGDVPSYWLVSYYPVRVGSRILGVGCVIVDITAQKQTEGLLKEADRRKDEFLATLAHELRNPLAPISNAMHLLKMHGTNDSRSQMLQDIVQRQVHHMVRLVDDLLDVGRITHGKLRLQRARVAIGAVLQQAIEASLPHIDRSEHRLTVSTPREPAYVDADAVRLSQVFANLLNNAAKYTPRGGNISVSLTRERGHAVVRIRDDGIGIGADKLKDVFSMFFQTVPRLDGARDGLGIGLSLSRALVEMHGGRIDARSEGHNLGSEFTVHLPLLDEADPPTPEKALSGDDASEAHRILVADDSTDSAESLAMLLRHMGNDVEVVNDGAEALRKAAGYRPDIVFLDIQMPGMNGYDTCREMRRAPWAGKACIVALTGFGQSGDFERSKNAGFNAHLIKPVDVRALSAVLARRSLEPSQVA